MKELTIAAAVVVCAIGAGVAIAIAYLLYLRYRTPAVDFWLGVAFVCGALAAGGTVIKHAWKNR